MTHTDLCGKGIVCLLKFGRKHEPQRQAHPVRAKLSCSFLLPSLTLNVLPSLPGGFNIFASQRKRGHLNHGERTCRSPLSNVLFRGSARPVHHTKLKAVVISRRKNMVPATCELVSLIVLPHLQGLVRVWPPAPPPGSPGSPRYHGRWAEIKGDHRRVVGPSWQL